MKDLNRAIHSATYKFCDIVQPPLAESQSKMELGFMIDIKIGGRIQMLASDVQRIIDEEERIELRLNDTKCKIVAKNVDVVKNYQICKYFKKVSREDLIIFGIPIL